ncbi:MAG: RNA polymerase sigma factor [Nitrospirota bacterium]
MLDETVAGRPVCVMSKPTDVVSDILADGTGEPPDGAAGLGGTTEEERFIPARSGGFNLRRIKEPGKSGTALNELDLVEASRNGDPEAFGALVKMYMPRAIAFARQMTGDADDAQDLAQDAFIKAYKALDSFKGGSSFYTWFIRILSNVCLDFLRKRTFIKKIFFFAAPEEEEDGHDAVDLAPDNSRSINPDMPLEQKELRAALKKALLSLPPRQRAVFLMKHEEDLKLSEIAVALKISEGAVKAHLFRAVETLKKGMKGYRYG